MSGICGVVAQPDGHPVSQPLLSMMNNLLSHRGPNDAGYYIDNLAGLGIRTDSAPTNHQQPIPNEDQSKWLLFDGEIFNYQALRQAFEKQGHHFATPLNGEVLLHAYEVYGEGCVAYLNGRFAFALWDAKERRLVLGRDRVGHKPLYYHHGKQHFVFGSELKAVMAHPHTPRDLNPLAIDCYLSMEYIAAPLTIYEEVYKLPAGHYLLLENGRCQLHAYWDLSPVTVPKDEQARLEKFDALIGQAVTEQTSLPPETTMLLSGGQHSSSLLAWLTAVQPQVRSVTVGFNGEKQDPVTSLLAKQFGTEHFFHSSTYEMPQQLSKLICMMDEPFAGFSLLPIDSLMHAVQKKGTTVLMGVGGDVIFGGRDEYLAQWLDTAVYGRLPLWARHDTLPRLLNVLPWQSPQRGVINKAKRFVEGGALSPQWQHLRWRISLTQHHKAALYLPQFKLKLGKQSSRQQYQTHFQRSPFRQSLAKQQYVDLKTAVVDGTLAVLDRVGAMHGIEARLPFLDYRVLEYALSLAEQQSTPLRKNQQLPKMMAGQLPTRLFRQQTRTLHLPVKNLLRREYHSLLLDTLSPDTLKRRGYFNSQLITHWIQEHLSLQIDHSHRLWTLMSLELWHQQMVDAVRESHYVETRPITVKSSPF